MYNLLLEYGFPLQFICQSAQLAEEVIARMETGQVLGTTLMQCTVLEGDKEPPDVRPFELYLVLQV